MIYFFWTSLSGVIVCRSGHFVLISHLRQIQSFCWGLRSVSSFSWTPMSRRFLDPCITEASLACFILCIQSMGNAKHRHSNSDLLEHLWQTWLFVPPYERLLWKTSQVYSGGSVENEMGIIEKTKKSCAFPASVKCFPPPLHPWWVAYACLHAAARAFKMTLITIWRDNL